MEKTNPPTTLGVFSPVGHVVAAFAEGTDLDAVERALTGAGLAGAGVLRMSPDEMIAQADKDLLQASPLASFGHELNLVKTHRDLAAQGNTFLVIEAKEDDQVPRIAEIVNRFQATSADRYGRWMIEELKDSKESP